MGHILKNYAFWLFFLLFSLPMTQAFADKIEGVVIAVSDGDTITVLTPEKKQVKVRLSEIDAPENGQPYARKSKNALSDLVFSKPVSVISEGVDKYGRVLGRVYTEEKDINLSLVEQGNAWAYDQYLKDVKIKDAEAVAKKNKLGLWSLHKNQIMPPWEWRKNTHEKAPPVMRESSTARFSCGYKTRCKQMLSCSEAKFYLRNCGVKSLDGDGDGTPCETICGKH